MHSNNLNLKEKNGVYYYTFPSFEKTGLVRHLFTSRIGGVSKEPYKSLNLGINTKDNIENIKKNFEKVLSVINNTVDNIVVSHQLHTTNVKIVDKNDIGKGINNIISEDGVDGLITNIPDIALFTFYADCVPIFYLDTVKRVVGLAHGGWRGTVNKIAGKVVDMMIESYNSNPKDIIVGIGPSIGPCCYEIGCDVYNKFNINFTNVKKLIKSIGKDRWRLNLWEANSQILKEKGIPSRNISISGICTSCHNDLFFSYRKEKGVTGRMAAVIQLNFNKEVY
jgi:hypothetical protein